MFVLNKQTFTSFFIDVAAWLLVPLVVLHKCKWLFPLIFLPVSGMRPLQLYLFVQVKGQHGEGQRGQWCAQVHVQCWKDRETSGHDQAVIQGDHQVPDGHAAPWLALLNLMPIWIASFWGYVPDYYCSILGYISEFEYVDDHRAGKIVVELNGRLNKCGVISPRFDVGVKEIEGWTARLLPSRQVSPGCCLYKIWLEFVCTLWPQC